MVQSLGPHLTRGDWRWKLTLAKTPLNLSLCLLIGIILFQLCPLPSWLIHAISPSTYDLYAATLPNGSEIGARTISIYPWASAQELYKLLAYIGVFYLVIYHFRDRIWLSRLVTAMVITGFIIAVIGILQHFATPEMIYGFRDASYASPFGPYINRNHFAGYMEMTIFVAIGLLLSHALKARPRKGGWRKYLYRWEAKLSQQALMVFSVVVMAVALALSLSRGGITSSVVALVFMGGIMAIRKRGSSLTIFVVLFSLSLFFLLWLGIEPVIGRLSTLAGLGSRIQVWQGVINIVKDFFPFGTGLGTISHIYPSYQTIDTFVILDHPENDYLEYFADLGIIGGIIWWGGLFWMVNQVLARWSERRRPVVVGLCLGCMTGAVSVFFHSIVDFNLHIPANALMFFVLLGVGFNTVHLRGEGRHMEVISPTRMLELSKRLGRIMLFLLLCGFVIYGGGIIRSYLAERGVDEVRAKINLHSQGLIPSWVDLDTLKHLRRAKGLAPGYAPPHYLLAKAYEQMALAQREEEGQAVFLDMAAQEYMAAIKREPTSPWYHLGLGWVYLVLSERDHSMKADAKREFATAARLAPKNPDIQDYIAEITESWTDTTP
jgi:O-antigen ligase